MKADTRRLTGLLDQAEAARRTGLGIQAGRPPEADMRLSSFLRLVLDDPQAASLLQNAAAYLRRRQGTQAVAAAIVEQAMTLTSADLGNVQLAEPNGDLRIVADIGFGPEFLDHFAVVHGDSAACGRAAAHQAQVVIADVETDGAFAPHRPVAAISKFRAVQSTPLIDADGKFVGIVSTHFPSPGRPTAHILQLTRLYGLIAGEAIARTLSGRSEFRREPSEDRSWTGGSHAAVRTTVIDTMDSLMRSLLSAGLSLAGAQSLIDDGAAGHVAAAVDELDHALGNIRSVALELHE